MYNDKIHLTQAEIDRLYELADEKRLRKKRFIFSDVILDVALVIASMEVIAAGILLVLLLIKKIII